MRRFYLSLSLLAVAVSAYANDSLTAAAVEEGGVVWSIESVAAGMITDGTLSVAQGFVVPAFSGMGGISKTAADGLDIKAYPNPVVDALTISCASDDSYEWQICGIDGKVVLSGCGKAGAAQVDCASLPSGQYILTIISGYGRQSALIIKK